MQLPTEQYVQQVQRWPSSGRHILAHFDESTIVVYQAYSPGIGQYAIRHGQFGGDFSFSRMSWIKPNFLWMMYRSSWGQAPGQQVVLGIRLKRTFFDSLLEQAVASSFSASGFSEESAWKSAVGQSEVRLQWDPDHRPMGEPCERRAVQLGLRGETLKAYGTREIVEIIDMSSFIAEQRPHLGDWKQGRLVTPREDVYRPASESAATNIGLDSYN